tara:strand:+ start:634 stop:768 length:135 start_codon:yes stop_codon:yes gene_type:complete
MKSARRVGDVLMNIDKSNKNSMLNAKAPPVAKCRNNAELSDDGA